MIWRETRRPATGEIDPEYELELRLVSHARAGAAWALSSLVARYQPPVVRYLTRLIGDQPRAHALAEQVFVRMGRRLRGPHGGEHLRLWLLRASTDVGLDVLRRPRTQAPPRLGAPDGPAGLLPVGAADTTKKRFFTGLGARGRKLPPSQALPLTQEFVWESPEMARSGDHQAAGSTQAAEHLSPRDALRHRLIRAVLAELPYGDAQCLALHLVAGLNQAEVAQALGVNAPVARRRVVQGLQVFGRRYEATLASLGLTPNFTEIDPSADLSGSPLTTLAPLQKDSLPVVMPLSEVTSADESLPEQRVAAVAPPTAEERSGAAAVAATPPGTPLAATELTDVVDPPDSALRSGALGVAPDSTLNSASPAGTDRIAMDMALVDVTSEGPDASLESAEPSDDVGLAPAEADVLSPASHVESTGLATDAPWPTATERDQADLFEAATPSTAARADDPPETDTADALAAHAISQPLVDIGEPRLVPVLAASTPAASTPLSLRPSDAIAGDGTTAVRPTPMITSTLPPSSPPADLEPEEDALIVWNTNPEIPAYVREGVSAALGTSYDAPMQRIAPEDDYLLVLEADREEPRAPALDGRRAQVLSADGEAEDPDESEWQITPR